MSTEREAGVRGSGGGPSKASSPDVPDIQFDPCPPRPPEEGAVEAVKREETLRTLVKKSLATGSPKLTEIDRRQTPNGVPQAKTPKAR